jgi:uncharacterized protein YjbJ (UPF0337 family)
MLKARPLQARAASLESADRPGLAKPHVSTERKEFIVTINKDQIKGTATEAVGKVEEQVGKLIGSNEQQVKGLEKQLEGKMQKGIGDLKEAVSDLKAAAKR